MGETFLLSEDLKTSLYESLDMIFQCAVIINVFGFILEQFIEGEVVLPPDLLGDELPSRTDDAG